MKLLVLGASGGIGRWVVQLAASKGHTVRALVRPGTAFDAANGVEIRRGEVLDSGVLASAAAGVDAVACCLGQRRAGRSPWSAPLSPPDLMARVTPLLVYAMLEAGVRRLVTVSAAGVADSERQLSAPVRWLVRQGQIGMAYRDLARMEKSLASADLDWLAVRPVTLANGAPTGQAGEVGRYGLLSSVRRSDVAAWMLSALESDLPLPPDRAVLLGRP